MQPMRRMHERRSRAERRFYQLWYSNPSFWCILILWAITGYKSFTNYQQLAQDLRPDNPFCSSSRTCLHIQIPLHLAFLGQFLSLYMLYAILSMVSRPAGVVGEGILMPNTVLRDWYRWYSLVIAIPAFVALVFMEKYDDDVAPVPWISALYAALRAGLVAAYFVLTMQWWTTIVAED